MTDRHLSTIAEVNASGLRPRRFRHLAILVRRLIWPALRAWFFHFVQQSARFEAELQQLRQTCRQSARQPPRRTTRSRHFKRHWPTSRLIVPSTKTRSGRS